MNEIIELINQTLEFNNIKSFKDIEELNDNELNDNKLFNAINKQWVSNKTVKDSDTIIFFTYQRIQIGYGSFVENYNSKYLNCNRPFDIYFIIGKYNNFYIIQPSENELLLIVMNKEVIFPTIESEYIRLNVEKIN